MSSFQGACLVFWAGFASTTLVFIASYLHRIARWLEVYRVFNAWEARQEWEGKK